MPAGQGAHPQIGSSSYIQVLLSSLPSGHFLTHTLSPRSHTICFRVCTGCSFCSFCLECPSHCTSLSNSYPSFKTPGELYLLWEVLPWHLVHPLHSIMPLCFPGCSSNHPFYKYVVNICPAPGTVLRM